MKRTCIIVALGICGALLIGCSEQSKSPSADQSGPALPSSNPSEYPVIVLDSDHQIHGTNLAPAYHISETSGIRLDGTQFSFANGTNSGMPNMVQVVVGQSQLLKLAKRTETNYFLLDQTTLTSVQGGPFRGFKSGDKLTLAVGHTISGNPAEEALSVYWVGTVEVK